MVSPPTTGAQRRADLLLQAWTLAAAADDRAVVELLSPLPEAELLDEPELGVLLAAAEISLMANERALELMERLREPCARPGREHLQRRLLNLEGVLHARAGRLGQAERCFSALLYLSTLADDPLQLAHALMNLGVAAQTRCEWAESLASFLRARTAFRRAGEKRFLAPVELGLGVTYRELGMAAEATRAFDRAAGFPQSVVLQAFTAMERAQLALAAGDTELAGELAERARGVFAGAGVQPGVCDTLRVLGRVALARGDLAAARARLDEARALLPEGEPMLRGEVLEELAVLAWREGYRDAAHRHADEAERTYRGMEAPRRAERMRLRLLLLRVEGEGDPQGA